eukprot:6664014-Prymnesium_polylepis.1
MCIRDSSTDVPRDPSRPKRPREDAGAQPDGQAGHKHNQNGVGGVHPASLTHHCPLRLALDGRL